jgi:hypothetical protein
MVNGLYAAHAVAGSVRTVAEYVSHIALIDSILSMTEEGPTRESILVSKVRLEHALHSAERMIAEILEQVETESEKGKI